MMKIYVKVCFELYAKASLGNLMKRVLCNITIVNYSLLFVTFRNDCIHYHQAHPFCSSGIGIMVEKQRAWQEQC